MEEFIDKHQRDKGGKVILRTKLALDKLKNQIQTSQERYLLNSSIDPEIFARKMTEIKAEEAALQNELSGLSRDTTVMRGVMEKILPGLKNLGTLFEG